MNRWRWQAQHWLGQLGRIGLLGLLLMALSAYLYAFKLRPLDADLDARSRALAPRAAALAVPPSTVLDEVEDRAGADRSFTQFLRVLNRQAQANRIALAEVSYQRSEEQEGKLRRYTITLPFESTYPDARMFLGAVRRHTGVRLERLSVKREDISQARLQVQLELSYLITVEPAP